MWPRDNIPGLAFQRPKSVDIKASASRFFIFVVKIFACHIQFSYWVSWWLKWKEKPVVVMRVICTMKAWLKTVQRDRILVCILEISLTIFWWRMWQISAIVQKKSGWGWIKDLWLTTLAEDNAKHSALAVLYS